MTKANITQYSSTASSNTDIDDINIDENCPASGLNNALRSLMAHLKNVDTGSQALTALSVTGALSAKGGAVFNEDSADVDFRVESNGDANMLFVDGGNDRIGIGTNSPQKLLHLKDGDIVVGNGTASNNAVIGRVGFSTDASNSRFIGIESFRGGDAANGDLRFHTFGGDGDNGERMRIDTAGNVGISNTSPDRLLVISGGGSGAGIDLTNAGGTVGQLRIGKSHSGGANGVIFKHSNSTVGTIDYDNSSTAYNTSSDYRLKENLSYDFNATTRLKQLKPARFNFKIDADKTVDGFLAHEVSSIVPEAISGEKDAVDADGNPIYQGIDQSKLVPLLTKALQEQQATIEALTARITALENA